MNNIFKALKSSQEKINNLLNEYQDEGEEKYKLLWQSHHMNLNLALMIDSSSTSEQINAAKEQAQTECRLCVDVMNYFTPDKVITNSEDAYDMKINIFYPSVRDLYEDLIIIQDLKNGRLQYDENAIDALREYSYKRTLNLYDYGNSFFQFSCLFFNFSKKEKLDATNHLIDLIDGKGADPLTNYEMRILNNGELGTLVKKLGIDLKKDFSCVRMDPMINP